MGTSGFPTSYTYRTFVRSINPYATLVVADYSPYPLRDCLDNGMQNNNNTRLARANATRLPFPDASFDLVETDALMQFLTLDDKKKTLREVYRVLAPGGIFTTRDKFISKDATEEEQFILQMDRRFTHDMLGVMPYMTSAEEMFELFTAQGFETVMQRPKEGDPTCVLLHDIVAQKPETVANN